MSSLKKPKPTAFPPEYKRRVDTTKVEVNVIRKWIQSKCAELFPDDDVTGGMVEAKLCDDRYPDIKQVQIDVTAFIGPKKAEEFCLETWRLFLDAQDSPLRIPQQLITAKKEQLEQDLANKAKAEEEAKRRREQEDRRDREIDTIRRRERTERGGGRGRGGYRGDRGDRSDRSDRDFGRRGRGYSPPPRRPHAPVEVDSYIPATSSRRKDDRRRGRSPTPKRSISSVSRSRSRSSPRRRRLSPSRSRSRSATPPRSVGHRRDRSRVRSRSRRRDRDIRRRRTPSPRPRRKRSLTPVNKKIHSRSRSPRPRRSGRERSLSGIRSQSAPRRSPPPKSSHRRRRYSSSSYSRSPARSLSPRNDRTIKVASGRRSPSVSSLEDKDVRTDVRKDNYRRPRSRRYSRSRDRSPRRSYNRRASVERYRPRGKRTRSPSSSSPDRAPVKRNRNTSSLERSVSPGNDKASSPPDLFKGNGKRTDRALSTPSEVGR